MQVLNKKYWPYQYRMSRYKSTKDFDSDLDFIEELVLFCRHSFDTKDWRNLGLYFCFKREEDAAFFTLRFGNGN